MAEGLKDLSSLDVVTFQGRVELTAQDKIVTFQQVMDKATGNTGIKVKVLASTRTDIDGDIVVFYDQDITEEQKLAHAEMVEIGRNSRAATVDFLKSLFDAKEIKDI